MTPSTDLTALRQELESYIADRLKSGQRVNDRIAIFLSVEQLRTILAALPREAPPALVAKVQRLQAAMQSFKGWTQAGMSQTADHFEDKARAALDDVLAWSPDAAPEGAEHPAGPVRTDFRAEDGTMLAPADEARKVISNCTARNKKMPDLLQLRRAIAGIIVERNRQAGIGLWFRDINTGVVTDGFGRERPAPPAAAPPQCNGQGIECDGCPACAPVPVPPPPVDRCRACGGPHFRCECCTTPGFDAWQRRKETETPIAEVPRCPYCYGSGVCTTIQGPEGCSSCHGTGRAASPVTTPDAAPAPEGAQSYDPAFGDDRQCACGHAYDRHFDSYDHNAPVGCKYCNCQTWVASPAAAPPKPSV